MKKGFTLIELLAVIVILAIIALIATPIILNIIKSSKEEAVLRSAENYLDAVTQAVARENLNNEFNPSTCDVTSEGNLSCSGHEVKVEIDGEKPSGNFVEFNNGKIVDYELVFEGGTVTPDGIKGSKTNTSNDVASGYISSVENLISSGKIQTTSEEIECDVTNESNISYIKCGSQDKVQVDISGTLPVGVIILKDDKAIRYNLMFGEESVIVHEDTIDEWDGTSVSTGLNGCGTEASPFLIQSAADLMYMRNQVNAGGTITLLDTTCGADSVTSANSASYKQTVNITLNSNSDNYLAWSETSPKNTWTPVGTSSTPFQGNYNGKVHYIEGIYSSDSNSAFIGYAKNVTIKNIEVNNSSFYSNDGNISGSIIAYLDTTSGTINIKNCSSNAQIISSKYSGGLIGYGFNNSSDFTSTVNLDNLVFSGNFLNGSSEVYTGGIIGYFSGVNLLNANNIINDSSILKNNSYAHGYVAGFTPRLHVINLNATNFTNSKKGVIKVTGSSSYGTSYISGFVADLSEVSIANLTNIKNYGDILLENSDTQSDITYAGGLIGFLGATGDVTIKNSFNHGNLFNNVDPAKHSLENVGGLIGRLLVGSKVTIENSYNIGNINSQYYTGGLIGEASGNRNTTTSVVEILKSYNKGSIVGSGYTGGLIGYVSNLGYIKFDETYNSANIKSYSNQNYVGGLIGDYVNKDSTTLSTLSNSYNSGNIEVEETDHIGGLIGEINYTLVLNNVYNSGNIIAKSSNRSYQISGLVNGSTNMAVYSTNIYNTGNITISTASGYSNLYGISSLVGVQTNKVYNSGIITNKLDNGTTVISGLFDHISGFENTGYLTSSASVGVSNYNRDSNNNYNVVYNPTSGIIEYENIEDMPSVLSVVNGDSKFKEDTNNINNGYPILSWQ